jgi:hypothetical protein
MARPRHKPPNKKNVIRLASRAEPWAWTFHAFDEAWGEIRDLGTDYKAALDAMVRNLIPMRVHARPYVGALKRGVWKGKKFFELRFKLGDVQQRPIISYGSQRDITILLPAEERGDEIIPRDACAIATRRRELLDGNPARRIAYKLGSLERDRRHPE